MVIKFNELIKLNFVDINIMDRGIKETFKIKFALKLNFSFEANVVI